MTRRGWSAVAIVGALLAIVGLIVAQTKKPKALVETFPTGPQTITVLSSNPNNLCVSVDDDSKPVGSAYTITWQPGPGVTNFHIIFPRKSPDQRGKKYFDQTNNGITALNKPANGVVEAFEYAISVDGGATCDPHVIVVP